MVKTTKFHIENILFLPLIMILWEPFSGKRSHWWNWSRYSKSINKGIKVEGNKSNNHINNLWNKLIELNFRWKKLVILQPVQYDGEYQIVYSGDTTEICSVVLKGKTACLVSSRDILFTAISYPDGNEIQLEVLGYTDKQELDKDILFI